MARVEIRFIRPRIPSERSTKEALKCDATSRRNGPSSTSRKIRVSSSNIGMPIAVRVLGRRASRGDVRRTKVHGNAHDCTAEGLSGKPEIERERLERQPEP